MTVPLNPRETKRLRITFRLTKPKLGATLHPDFFALCRVRPEEKDRALLQRRQWSKRSRTKGTSCPPQKNDARQITIDSVEDRPGELPMTTRSYYNGSHLCTSRVKRVKASKIKIVRRGQRAIPGRPRQAATKRSRPPSDHIHSFQMIRGSE